MVFAFDLQGQTIGTIRLMPMGHDLTLTEKLLANTGRDIRQWSNSWDCGRLVVSPEFRVGQEVLKTCLHLTLDYLVDNVEVDNLWGSCTHVLSRLYRRFGFSVFAANVPLPGTEKNYTLIHGTTAAVFAGLSPSGSELAASAVRQ